MSAARSYQFLQLLCKSAQLVKRKHLVHAYVVAEEAPGACLCGTTDEEAPGACLCGS